MSLEPMLRHAPRGLSGAHAPRHLSRPSSIPVCARTLWCALALLAFTSTAALAATFETRPLVSADDAEQSLSGSMYLTSGDLEFVMDGTTQQLVGIRWPGVTIPQGATITAAWVQFSADETHSEATTLTIRAQAADNAPSFTTTRSELSSRALGTAFADWTPAAWTAGQAGAAQRTPGLAALIQQVVSRPGWASGNAIVLVFSGSGHRTAKSRDGSATLAPLLHVEYSGGSTPPPDLPPVASITVAPVASPPLTVSASGAGSTDTDATPIASYRFDFGDGTPAVVTTAPTSSATHTYASGGTYTVTLLVTDTGGLTSLPASASVTVSSGGGGGTPTTVEKRTLASSDDAEEAASGSVATSSSDLEFVTDGTTLQTVGMRWPALAIPPGATITTAWVQFTADESHSEATTLRIRAQAVDNAPAFTTTKFSVSTRALGTAFADWSPVAWTAGQVGAAQRTPELAALIQQVVSRPGWVNGNAIVLVVTGTGHRTAKAFDGSAAQAPLLHVEYTGGTFTDQPPVASLSVSPVSSPPLTVSASGAGSTDTDATPIASYRFDFGDGTPAVTTTAPVSSTTHTYAAAGTYTVTLRVTDTAGLTSSPVTATATVSTTSGGPLAVYAGYYSTHHPDEPQPKPNPWQGSSGVVFVGTPDSPSGGWDTSAIRIDNLSTSSITLTATVDIGSDRFALWGSRTVPAGQKLILAQTGFENFDGSDTNPAGCYGCDPRLCVTQVRSTVPVVNITVNGVTTRYYDTGQVINTGGVDAAGCPPTDGRLDESQNWIRIYTSTGAAPAASNGVSSEPGTTRAGALWLARPYPNPVQDELSLRFHTPTRGIVNLSIYDIAGRLVMTSLDHEFGPGEYLKVVPVRGIMAGRYFARLRTSDGELHQSFVITR